MTPEQPGPGYLNADLADHWTRKALADNSPLYADVANTYALLALREAVLSLRSDTP